MNPAVNAYQRRRLPLVLLAGFVASFSLAFAATPPSVLPGFRFVKENPVDGSQTLLGHVPTAVATSTLVSHAAPAEPMRINVVLPLQPGVDDFIRRLYDPESPIFHQFLTPQQFCEQFGPSPADSEQVKRFLASHGLVAESQPGCTYVLRVTGSVSSVEGAFNLRINHYKRPDGTVFFAPDAVPTIHATVAAKIRGVVGLDNLPRYHARSHPAPVGLYPLFGTGPNGCIAPADIATAYNLKGIPSTGAGQTVALFELAGYDPKDIAAFEDYFHLPHVPLENIAIDGFNPSDPTKYNAEDALDIEMLVSFSPKISKILVYEAPSNSSSVLNLYYRIATDNLAKVISISWGSTENYTGSDDIGVNQYILQQMAAQGQAVFVAAGDCGAYDDAASACTSVTLAVDEPAAEPYVTGVGISKLAVNAANGVWQSETASTQGGGGISSYETIPFYQAGMISTASLGSTTMRNVPDVVLTSDNSNTGFAVYVNGGWNSLGGSSATAPIWAAFAALVNQGRAAAGQTPLGFMNPALYAIARGTNYTNDFHDTVGGNNGFYPAVPGYDCATGLGSFNGLNLYNDLVAPTSPAVLGARLSGTGFQMSFVGPGGKTYAVLSSTNLALAVARWATNATGTFTGSTQTFTNAAPTGLRQFYRIKSP